MQQEKQGWCLFKRRATVWYYGPGGGCWGNWVVQYEIFSIWYYLFVIHFYRWFLRFIDSRSNGSICYLLLVELYERVIRFKLFSRYTNLVSFLLLRFLWDLHEVSLHATAVLFCWAIREIIMIIIIMTLLDNTITGKTSSSHCGPLKLQIQIAKIQSKNTVKN